MSRAIRLLTALAILLGSLLLLTPFAEAGRNDAPAPAVMVDTDIGVDDAVAIAWLLNQPKVKVVGFTTVAGNTSVDNATRNLLTLFGAVGRQYPVAIGAAAPLEFPASRTGLLAHGLDGLWFNQQPADISALPTDAPAAMAAAARANPGLTIIALGPLTNVAQAVQQYPADLAGVRLVALAGAQRGGNRTPVSEFNAFADPHALAVVLASPMRVELLTLDAFDQVTVDAKRFPQRLARRGGPTGQLLAAAVGGYFQAQQAGGPADQIAIPDVAAVVYALRPRLGTAQSALVDVVTDDGVTRGQTIIATDFEGRLPMIADDAEFSALAEQAFMPGFDLNAALFAILQRRPDNATVILDVDDRSMVRLLERDLTR